MASDLQWIQLVESGDFLIERCSAQIARRFFCINDVVVLPASCSWQCLLGRQFWAILHLGELRSLHFLCLLLTLFLALPRFWWFAASSSTFFNFLLFLFFSFGLWHGSQHFTNWLDRAVGPQIVLLGHSWFSKLQLSCLAKIVTWGIKGFNFFS